MMKALEILLDGKRKTICGSKKLKQLAVQLQLHWPPDRERRDPNAVEYFIDIQGLSEIEDGEEEVLKWVTAKLSTQSEITIRVIDVEEADVPIDKQIIKSRHEKFLKEQYESAKSTYFRYKDKYE